MVKLPSGGKNKPPSPETAKEAVKPSEVPEERASDVNSVAKDSSSFNAHKVGVVVTRGLLNEALNFTKKLEKKNNLAPEMTLRVLHRIVAHYESNLPAIEARLALPTVAPERWAERDLNRRENAPMFIRRVYEEWLGHGLARKDLAKLDDDLYKALSVWLSRHPDDDIAKLLPSQSDIIDNLIERLSVEYPVEVLRKLGYAIDSRLRRKPESSD